MFDPTLYFVTPAIGDDRVSWEKLIREAVRGGVTMVQIRDKTSSKKKIIEAARAIHPFLKAKGVPLLINDHVDIAHLLKLDGVHVGQSDLPVAEARAILGPGAIIGISLENREQIASSEGADYVAASPVFPSRVKKELSPWGLEGVRALREATSLPLVAIGGIRESNFLSLLEVGVDGVAVVCAISESTTPRESAARLIHRWLEAKNALSFF